MWIRRQLNHVIEFPSWPWRYLEKCTTKNSRTMNTLSLGFSQEYIQYCKGWENPNLYRVNYTKLWQLTSIWNVLFIWGFMFSTVANMERYYALKVIQIKTINQICSSFSLFLIPQIMQVSSSYINSELISVQNVCTYFYSIIKTPDIWNKKASCFVGPTLIITW